MFELLEGLPAHQTGRGFLSLRTVLSLTLRKSVFSYPAPKAVVYCLEISKRPVNTLCNSGVPLSHAPPSPGMQPWSPLAHVLEKGLRA